jgi:hypothetical protein
MLACERDKATVRRNLMLRSVKRTRKRRAQVSPGQPGCSGLSVGKVLLRFPYLAREQCHHTTR